MLIRFRVENHRSLRDEQTLSLVAATNGNHGDGHLLHPAGLSEALLPAVALYGANASGKTNVLLALAFMRDAVINSHRLWAPGAGCPVEPFALSGRQQDPSLYEVEVLIDNVRYRYGFVLSSQRVEEEWLYAWPATRRQTRFERQGDDYEFGRSLGSNVGVIRDLTRTNSLFLSSGAQNNNTELSRVFEWFLRLQIDIDRTRPYFGGYRLLTRRLAHQFLDPVQLSLFQDEEFGRSIDRQMLVQLLQSADTGILDLRSSADELDTRKPGIYFRHKTDHEEGAWLPIEVESAGTIRLLDLATRFIPLLRTGGVLCVDEIEASLHPMLAAALLRRFCDPVQNPNGAQLIFTTHDTNLLGNILGFSPLRRDQVWLTEKDESGATRLYPLTEFHPRKHENLERGYLQGRYGAVPFLGELLATPNGVEQP